jgi:hypothetical protein
VTRIPRNVNAPNVTTQTLTFISSIRVYPRIAEQRLPKGPGQE